jgi:hypothetical protein
MLPISSNGATTNKQQQKDTLMLTFTKMILSTIIFITRTPIRICTFQSGTRQNGTHQNGTHQKAGNTNRGGRLGTVDPFIEVACFVKVLNNISI